MNNTNAVIVMLAVALGVSVLFHALVYVMLLDACRRFALDLENYSLERAAPELIAITMRFARRLPHGGGRIELLSTCVVLAARYDDRTLPTLLPLKGTLELRSLVIANSYRLHHLRRSDSVEELLQLYAKGKIDDDELFSGKIPSRFTEQTVLHLRVVK